MPTFDPVAFGERLRRHMDERDLDVKSLRQQVSDATGGARGTSYGTVWSYVKGHAPLEPRREVVEALAALLDVLPEYLLHGGAKSQAEAAILEREDEREDEREGSLITEWMLEELEGLDRLDVSVHLALMTLSGRWLTAMERSGRELESEDEVKAYLLSTWAFLWAPLTGWGRWIDRDVHMDQGSLSDYMTAMLHAMNLSLQVVAPPGLTPEDVATWPKYPTEETDDAEA